MSVCTSLKKQANGGIFSSMLSEVKQTEPSQSGANVGNFGSLQTEAKFSYTMLLEQLHSKQRHFKPHVC